MVRARNRLVTHSNRASVYLDWARGLAAIEVMTYHMRPTLLVSWVNVAHKNVAELLLYGLTDKGFQAVMIFFVLSGFFISSSVVSSLAKGTWSWGKYLNNRLTRLWLVLLPALVLTYLWNTFSSAVFHGQALVGIMNVRTLLSNVFFLQGIGPIPEIPFGGNAALWSLAYEFWYYLLFPCILLIFFSKKWSSRVTYAAITIAMCLFLGKSVLMYFAVWLVGSLLVVVPKLGSRWKYSRTSLALSFVIFLIALGLSKRNHTYISDLSIGVTFGLFVFVILSFFNDSQLHVGGLGRLGQKIAGFSYTLYLVHFPVNDFLVSWVAGRKLQPEVKTVVMLFGIFLFTLLYAWLVSMVTEAHTARVRVHSESVFRSARRALKIPRVGVRQPAQGTRGEGLVSGSESGVE